MHTDLISFMNIPDHPDFGDKGKKKKPGSDEDHAKDHEKDIQNQKNPKDPKRQHGKTRSELKK